MSNYVSWSCFLNMIGISVLYTLFMKALTYDSEYSSVHYSSNASFEWTSMPQPILEILSGRGFKFIIVEPPRSVKKIDFCGNIDYKFDVESEGNFYYTLSGEFMCSSELFVYQDNETVFNGTGTMYVWILYHLTNGDYIRRNFYYELEEYCTTTVESYSLWWSFSDVALTITYYLMGAKLDAGSTAYNIQYCLAKFH